jgi:hypothetical protein
MRSLRTLAEHGAELMADEPTAARRGIEETVEFLAFWEHELARMVDCWRDEHRDGGALQ